MIELLLFLNIFIGLFLLFRIRTKDKNDFDFYFHKFMVNSLSEKGIESLMKNTNRLIRPAVFLYPFLCHWLLSLLPKLIAEIMLKYINIFLHFLYAAIIYVFIYHLFDNIRISLLSVSLYMFSPIFFSKIAVGPRVLSFTPRLFGELLGMIYYIVYFFYLFSGKTYLIFLLLLISNFIFLVSKFSIQAIVFGTILISITTFTVLPVISLGLGFLLACVLSKGMAFKLIAQQIKHLKWYCLNNLKGKMHVSNTLKLKPMINAVRSGDMEKLARIIFIKNNFTAIFFKFPAFYIACFSLIGQIFSGSPIGYISIFFLIPMFLFFLMCIDLFLFLGEAERYLNYFTPFIFSTLILGNKAWMTTAFYFTIFFGIGFIFLELLYENKTKKHNNHVEEMIFKKLRKIPGSLNIATIPYHLLGGWRILSDTNKKWLYNAGFWVEKRDEKQFDSFMLKYPVLDLTRLDQIIMEYDLSIVFIKEEVCQISNFPFTKLKNIGMSIVMIADVIIVTDSEHMKFFENEDNYK